MAYSILSQMACSLFPAFEVTTAPMTRTGGWAAANDTYCTTAQPNGTEQHLYETAAAAGNNYKSNYEPAVENLACLVGRRTNGPRTLRGSR